MSTEARILVVDDDEAVCRMIGRALRREGYALVTENRASKVLDRLRVDDHDVLLSDVQMPGMDGLELTRQALELRPDLQVVLVTGLREADTAIQALRVGAVDYLVKPFRVDDLRFVVRRALERRRLLDERRVYRESLERQVRDRTRELSERNREVEALLLQLQSSYEETLQSLTAALDFRDHETRGHSARVVAYADLLGRMLGLDEDALRHLRWGAILHDIGKIAVPDAILRKPGPLDEEEKATIRHHPELGYQMLRHVSFLGPALEIVLHHHEWWDGSGYPFGLEEEAIPHPARIFSVVDTYDAMTTVRPYRAAAAPAVAREELLRFAGRQFDPTVVDAFVSLPQGELDALRREVEAQRTGPDKTGDPAARPASRG